MAIRTDWILLVIERLGQALASLAKTGDSQPVDDALMDLCGMGLARLDALPSWALVNLFKAGDRAAERRQAVADALEVLAEHGPPEQRASRLAKAAALRG